MKNGVLEPDTADNYEEIDAPIIEEEPLPIEENIITE